jgi:hypothetical protein
MDVCCEYWVFSGRGLCDELITRPEESYRLWCFVVCDLRVETWWMRRPWPTRGCRALKQPTKQTNKQKQTRYHHPQANQCHIQHHQNLKPHKSLTNIDRGSSSHWQQCGNKCSDWKKW